MKLCNVLMYIKKEHKNPAAIQHAYGNDIISGDTEM